MQQRSRLLAKSLLLVAVVASLVAVACQSEYDKHYDLAKDLKDQDRLDEAIKEYELAAQADPTRGKAYYRIGQIYKKRDEQPKAAEYFRKAIEAEPDYVDAYPELVKALVRSGEIDQATDVAKDALAKPIVKREPQAVQELEEQLLEIEKIRKAKAGQPPPPSAKPADTP